MKSEDPVQCFCRRSWLLPPVEYCPPTPLQFTVTDRTPNHLTEISAPSPWVKNQQKEGQRSGRCLQQIGRRHRKGKVSEAWQMEMDNFRFPATVFIFFFFFFLIVSVGKKLILVEIYTAPLEISVLKSVSCSLCFPCLLHLHMLTDCFTSWLVKQKHATDGKKELQVQNNS